MNYLVEKTFANRGYTPEYLREINNPYYEELKDIDTLAARLKEIHDAGLPITIIPDFDMDGICAGDCGYGGMAELGFKVILFIPNAAEGYGISAKTIDDVLAVYPDTKVIITCDTGISAVAAALAILIVSINFVTIFTRSYDSAQLATDIASVYDFHAADKAVGRIHSNRANHIVA